MLVDALRSIRSRKGRTGALASAVALGVALAVATAGVSMSARSQVSDAFDAHLNRDVTVRWYSEDAIDNQLRTDSELLVALDSLSGVGAVALLDDLGGHSIQASSVRSTYTTRVFAGQGDLTQAARAEVTWAVNHDQTLQPGEALVGEQLASTLSLGPIDMRPTIAIDGIPVAVVGVIIDSPRLPEMSGAVVVAADGSRSNERESRTALLLTMPGGAQQVARQAPLVVNPYSPLSLEVNAPIDPAELRDEIEGHVRTTLIIVTVVALLGAIAGLANAMLLSVGERKQEIGLRRAVGAKAAHVSRLIATESTIIGFLGGILGLAVGLVAVLATTIAQSWIPVFDLRLAPVAIVGGIAVGSLAGLFAAVRAGQIRPHLALRL